jgi:bifunctional non-homologous end joining protein LigD
VRAEATNLRTSAAPSGATPSSGGPEGIFVNPFERGEIGPELFQAVCRMGLEGLVSKHRDRPYQAGRSKHWVKVKNPTHPAMYRMMDALA